MAAQGLLAKNSACFTVGGISLLNLGVSPEVAPQMA